MSGYAAWADVAALPLDIRRQMAPVIAQIDSLITLDHGFGSHPRHCAWCSRCRDERVRVIDLRP